MNALTRSTLRSATAICTAGLALTTLLGAEPGSPFIGRWALTLPDGGAGWLGVTQEAGHLDASLLWGGGSVVPLASAFLDGDNLYVTRTRELKRKDATGKVVRTHVFTDVLLARIASTKDELSLAFLETGDGGVRRSELSGRRIPDLPPRPDLSKLKFGNALRLFNGTDLTGWRLTSPGQKNGWRVEKGELVNDPIQEEGKPHISYGNLRTEQEFEDFNLTLEFNVGKNGNSGVYLRGIYEVQVADTFGKRLDSHNMGGIYSRITPSTNAEKPAGEWQHYDITLVDRHVTVILNGTKIIDNAPLLGCTGGALWADEFRPGPIYFQGDHTGVRYRNVTLRPVVK